MQNIFLSGKGAKTMGFILLSILIYSNQESSWNRWFLGITCICLLNFVLISLRSINFKPPPNIAQPQKHLTNPKLQNLHPEKKQNLNPDFVLLLQKNPSGQLGILIISTFCSISSPANTKSQSKWASSAESQLLHQQKWRKSMKKSH